MKRLLENSLEVFSNFIPGFGQTFGYKRRLLSLEKSNIVNCKSISDRLLATFRRFSKDFYRSLI